MSEALRVLLLTSRLSQAAGGLAVSVPGMARHLDAPPALETHVMGTRDPAAPDAWADWGPRVHPQDPRGPVALHYAPSLAEAMERLAPDVVDVQGLWTYPSLANLRHFRRHRHPYLVTPRGMLDPWARQNSAWKKTLAGWLFEIAHLRNARCLRATADMEAGHFRSFGLRNPVAIVPNGVTIPPLLPRPEKPLNRLLFLSRIHPKKGLPYLLRSWATLESRHPTWELVIAGPEEGSHEAEMKDLARKLGLKRIGFRGPVRGADKAKLYRGADLFVLPTHAENFGLVVAEALAYEVPVITTHNAPWAELPARGCGWWIPLRSESLDAALDDALARPVAELHAMGARGRAWMERAYGWGGVAEQMQAVYEWLIKGGPRPQSIVD